MQKSIPNAQVGVTCVDPYYEVAAEHTPGRPPVDQAATLFSLLRRYVQLQFWRRVFKANRSTC